MSTLVELRNLASAEDHRLGAELKKAELYFELDLPASKVDEVHTLFGRLAARELRTMDMDVFIKKYPALTLVALVGNAGVSYERRRYWETFWQSVALTPHQDYEAELRHSLRSLLAHHGMREFPELFARNDYVGVLTLHAGIPVAYLSDVIDTIDEHVHKGRDATGAALLEWLTEPGHEYRLDRLTAPIRNFLRLSGEIAIDILDRIIEFLMFTLEHPDEWTSQTLDASTTGLPSLLIDGLVTRLQERPFGAARTAPPATLHRTRPTLSYSITDDQVMVGVPYPDEAATAPWQLRFAGGTRMVYAEPGWGIGSNEEHPHTPVAINAPARQVLLIHEASGAHYDVVLFDPADPLLVFAAEGRLISRQSALPRGVVIALHPKDATLVDAATGQQVKAVEEARVPSGWAGWEAKAVDLSAHDSVMVRRRGREDGAVRRVRSLGAPRFEPEEPLCGIITANGMAVHGLRPWVVLPPHRGDAPVEWQVRVRRDGQKSFLVDELWDSTDGDGYLDPFDGLPNDLLGRYIISVRRHGSTTGAEQVFTIYMAEGLEVEHGQEFRVPVRGGLAETESKLHSSAALTIDREVVHLGREEREAAVHVAHGGAEHRLIVRPPFLEARLDPVGAPAQWRTSVPVIAPEELAARSVIAVRIPGDVSPRIVLTDAGGTAVQEARPDTPARGVFQLPTARFADTAQQLGSGSLVALVDDSSGVTYRVPIAQIRPVRLCTDVSVEGQALCFEGLVDDEDMAAWVWAATAPWKPVMQVAIQDAAAEMPEELRSAGPLMVEVFKDDPWEVITRPDRPGPAAIRVDQPGWFRDTDPAWDGLARYLSGPNRGVLLPGATRGAWAVLAGLDWAARDAETVRVRDGLVRMLCNNPRLALEALGYSTIPFEEKMALLVRTHIIDYIFSAAFTLNDLHPDPWVGCMVEVSDLPSLFDRRDEVGDERQETLAYLRNQGGDMLIDLLRSGTAGDPRAGIFDATACQLDGLPDEKVEELFEQFRLVPGAVLDLDTRTSATADAFRARQAWSTEAACRVLPGHLSRVLRQIKHDAPRAYDLIAARNEALDGIDTGRHPWMLLSMQSLALALTARLYARRLLRADLMTRDMREAWAQMAERFPALVAGDVLIADATATFISHGNLIGDAE